jgi:hypothetical protein
MGLVHRQPYPPDGCQMKTELTASEPFTRGRIIAMFMAIALGTTPIVPAGAGFRHVIRLWA